MWKLHVSSFCLDTPSPRQWAEWPRKGVWSLMCKCRWAKYAGLYKIFTALYGVEVKVCALLTISLILGACLKIVRVRSGTTQRCTTPQCCSFSKQNAGCVWERNGTESVGGRGLSPCHSNPSCYHKHLYWMPMKASHAVGTTETGPMMKQSATKPDLPPALVCLTFAHLCTPHTCVLFWKSQKKNTAALILSA